MLPLVCTYTAYNLPLTFNNMLRRSVQHYSAPHYGHIKLKHIWVVLRFSSLQNMLRYQTFLSIHSRVPWGRYQEWELLAHSICSTFLTLRATLKTVFQNELPLCSYIYNTCKHPFLLNSQKIDIKLKIDIRLINVRTVLSHFDFAFSLLKRY